MQRKKLWVMMAPMFLAAASACEGPASEIEGDVTATVSALEAENGLTWNGLTFNGLAFNGLSFNGLSFNGLTWNGLAFNGLAFNGLSFNGITFNGLADPTVNQFVTYLVQCALPEGDSVTYDIKGQKHTFAGDIGLAPEWKKQSCDGECQRWMTACMLSRLNRLGEHVEISMRGEHRALKMERNEARDFQDREAAYYGNLFEGDDQIYACHSPGSPSIPRVCGKSLANCPMNVVGSCDLACRGTGRHDSFRDCGTRASMQKRDRAIDEVITVFLRE